MTYNVFGGTLNLAQSSHRYYLKIYAKMCHKIILRQKLRCPKISLSYDIS